VNAVLTIFAVGSAAIPLLVGVVGELPGPWVLLAHALVRIASPAHAAAMPASRPRITGIVISTLRILVPPRGLEVVVATTADATITPPRMLVTGHFDTRSLYAHQLEHRATRPKSAIFAAR